MNFTINEKFKNLINPPTEEEKNILEENILKDGVRHPLTVWKEKGILIDGHTRLEICQKHNLPYEIEEISLSDEDHAMSWMANNQLGRRNITDQQKTYLLGKLYQSEKKINGGDRKSINVKSLLHFEEVISEEPAPPKGNATSTSKKIAQQKECSASNVERAEKYADAVDTISNLFDTPAEERNNLLSGKVKIPKVRLKELALVAQSEPELAKQQYKEESVGKKKKTKKRKKTGRMANIIQNNTLPDSMDKLFRDLMFELEAAKDEKWATVSKETIAHYINKLNDIIDL